MAGRMCVIFMDNGDAVFVKKPSRGNLRGDFSRSCEIAQGVNLHDVK
ncbi:MAG: hypothetical protein IJU61_03350 [Victivallales bacterium]|jgi:hypothetical protein|nr:hypothetical protein [Victivallales bacterium]